MKRKKSVKLKIFMGVSIFLIVLASAFFIYVGSYYRADSSAFNSIKSDSAVNVEDNEDIIFKPVSNAKNIGFIFYPGGKVEAEAYSPIAKEIASNGYTVVIAKMKFNLAIFSPNRAEDIIKSNKEINTWVIGGHSLGGVMAADYAFKDSRVKGLVLLASYPQEKSNLINKQIKVLSLWGSNDKVADLNKVKEAKKVVPSDSKFVEIEGGNHGGFGAYGPQKGDGEAFITNEEQMKYTSRCIVELLDSLN